MQVDRHSANKLSDKKFAATDGYTTPSGVHIPQSMFDEVNKLHRSIRLFSVEARVAKSQLNKKHIPHLYDEYGVQRHLSDCLNLNSIKHNKELPVDGGGRIDILTQKTIIEVKKHSSDKSLYGAIGQLTYYKASLRSYELRLCIVALGKPSKHMKNVIEQLDIKYFDINDIIEKEQGWKLISTL